jgi:hypothetical protein
MEFNTTNELVWFKAIYVLSTSAAEKKTTGRNSEVMNEGVCVGQAVLKMALEEFCKSMSNPLQSGH